eukprot:842140-Amphidinium_carterae.2
MSLYSFQRSQFDSVASFYFFTTLQSLRMKLEINSKSCATWGAMVSAPGLYHRTRSRITVQTGLPDISNK